MQAELAKRQFSYLSVRPQLAKWDVINPYFDILQGRKLPIEKLLEKNQNILATREYLQTGLQSLRVLGQFLANLGVAHQIDLTSYTPLLRKYGIKPAEPISRQAAKEQGLIIPLGDYTLMRGEKEGRAILILTGAESTAYLGGKANYIATPINGSYMAWFDGEDAYKAAMNESNKWRARPQAWWRAKMDAVMMAPVREAPERIRQDVEAFLRLHNYKDGWLGRMQYGVRKAGVSLMFGLLPATITLGLSIIGIVYLQPEAINILAWTGSMLLLAIIMIGQANRNMLRPVYAGRTMGSVLTVKNTAITWAIALNDGVAKGVHKAWNTVMPRMFWLQENKVDTQTLIALIKDIVTFRDTLSGDFLIRINQLTTDGSRRKVLENLITARNFWATNPNNPFSLSNLRIVATRLKFGLLKGTNYLLDFDVVTDANGQPVLYPEFGPIVKVSNHKTELGRDTKVYHIDNQIKFLASMFPVTGIIEGHHIGQKEPLVVRHSEQLKRLYAILNQTVANLALNKSIPYEQELEAIGYGMTSEFDAIGELYYQTVEDHEMRHFHDQDRAKRITANLKDRVLKDYYQKREIASKTEQEKFEKEIAGETSAYLGQLGVSEQAIAVLANLLEMARPLRQAYYDYEFYNDFSAHDFAALQIVEMFRGYLQSNFRDFRLTTSIYDLTTGEYQGFETIIKSYIRDGKITESNLRQFAESAHQAYYDASIFVGNYADLPEPKHQLPFFGIRMLKEIVYFLNSSSGETHLKIYKSALNKEINYVKRYRKNNLTQTQLVAVVEILVGDIIKLRQQDYLVVSNHGRQLKLYPLDADVIIKHKYNNGLVSLPYSGLSDKVLKYSAEQITPSGTLVPLRNLAIRVFTSIGIPRLWVEKAYDWFGVVFADNWASFGVLSVLAWAIDPSLMTDQNGWIAFGVLHGLQTYYYGRTRGDWMTRYFLPAAVLTGIGYAFGFGVVSWFGIGIHFFVNGLLKLKGVQAFIFVVQNWLNRVPVKTTSFRIAVKNIPELANAIQGRSYNESLLDKNPLAQAIKENASIFRDKDFVLNMEVVCGPGEWFHIDFRENAEGKRVPFFHVPNIYLGFAAGQGKAKNAVEALYRRFLAWTLRMNIQRAFNHLTSERKQGLKEIAAEMEANLWEYGAKGLTRLEKYVLPRMKGQMLMNTFFRMVPNKPRGVLSAQVNQAIGQFAAAIKGMSTLWDQELMDSLNQYLATGTLPAAKAVLKSLAKAGQRAADPDTKAQFATLSLGLNQALRSKNREIIHGQITQTLACLLQVRNPEDALSMLSRRIAEPTAEEEKQAGAIWVMNQETRRQLQALVISLMKQAPQGTMRQNLQFMASALGQPKLNGYSSAKLLHFLQQLAPAEEVIQQATVGQDLTYAVGLMTNNTIVEQEVNIDKQTVVIAQANVSYAFSLSEEDLKALPTADQQSMPTVWVTPLDARGITSLTFKPARNFESRIAGYLRGQTTLFDEPAVLAPDGAIAGDYAACEEHQGGREYRRALWRTIMRAASVRNRDDAYPEQRYENSVLAMNNLLVRSKYWAVEKMGRLGDITIVAPTVLRRGGQFAMSYLYSKRIKTFELLENWLQLFNRIRGRNFNVTSVAA